LHLYAGVSFTRVTLLFAVSKTWRTTIKVGDGYARGTISTGQDQPVLRRSRGCIEDI
jgi:hypothetical protein